MMDLNDRGSLAAVIGLGLLLSALPAGALASEGGGVPAEPGVAQVPAGGAEYGTVLRTLPGRPRVRVPRLTDATVTRGTAPRVRVRVERKAARSVRVRIVLVPAHGATRALAVRRLATGRTVTLALPRALRPGTYTLRVVALGGAGEANVRSRPARLVVRAEPKPRKKARKRRGGSPPPPPPSLGGPRTRSSGVFPVQGSYTFGGSGGRFGAGRTGHTHEGQDIAAASGTPVVAPLAGEVLFNDYQASAAGRYVVLAADNGWHMFFAHCLAGSATVEPGTRVAAGDPLCRVGATGDASGPHLHFELWPDGWRHIKGTRPIDPLPQLRAWAQG